MIAMSFIWTTLLSSAIIVLVTAENVDTKANIIAGYVPGHSGMPPIDPSTCRHDTIFSKSKLSDALECARTCQANEKPKICYYKLTLEVYQINGPACNLCTPNVTNSICANCQCVPGDGVYRTALTMNRMMPGPSIQVCLGDYIVVDVDNRIPGTGVSIHWHGIFQKNYQYYDGVPNLTQCPISYGNSFRYQFYANNGGTHFYHAHTGLHKMDGVFGSLIIRKPQKKEPEAKLYEYDLANHVISISDWMNELSVDRLPGRAGGKTGNLPDSFLINGKGRYTYPNGTRTNTSLEVITVDGNKRYRVRLINSFCSTCSSQFIIEGHNLTVIASDAQPVKPVVVDSIVMVTGERFDFVINTNQKPGAYWIQLRGLTSCAAGQIQQLAILQYLGADTKPVTPEPTYTNALPSGLILNPESGDCSAPLPGTICINELRRSVNDKKDVLSKEPDVKLYLPFGFNIYTEEKLFQPNTYQKFLMVAPVLTSSTIDNITFEFPPAPPLSQPIDIDKDQFCNRGNRKRNCNETCKCTHLIDVPLKSVVEFILVDESNAPQITHSIHIHGYEFRVLAVGQPLGPTVNATSIISVDYVKELDAKNLIKRNFDHPPGKDSLTLPDNGYAVIRFYANNPGYWLFHCHFIYHQISGMELVIRVGNRIHLPPVPLHFPKCNNFLPHIYPD